MIGELSLIQDTLKEALSKGKTDERDKENILISADISIFHSFPLDTTCYDDLEIETLAKYVKVDTLRLLQRVYRMIYDYNEVFMQVYMGYRINIKLTNELAEQIEQVIKALN